MKQQESFWVEFKCYVLVTIALFFIALGWTGFLIPNHIIGGGVSGIAGVLYWATGLSTGITIFTLNVVLIVIGFKSLGWRFSVRTIYAIVMMSLFFSIGEQYFGDNPIIEDKFLATVLAAGMNGAANAIIFLQGSSTGGTDIIIMMINKFRNISLGRVNLLMNVVIASSSFFIFKDLDTLIYSYVVLMVSSYALDAVMNGSKQSVQMFIFSSKPNIIADRIGNEVHRGVTIIKGKGWYSKADNDILMVVVRKTESQMVIRIVKAEDQQAFVSVNSVMGVYGKGFDVMKK